jgi:GDP-L-fucose synthase
VDDLADALVFIARTYSEDGFVNIGTGDEVSIAALAHMVADAVSFEGSLEFDASKPDGKPRKQVDTAKLNALGWTPSISLARGVAEVYRWFLANGTGLRTGRAVT